MKTSAICEWSIATAYEADVTTARMRVASVIARQYDDACERRVRRHRARCEVDNVLIDGAHAAHHLGPARRSGRVWQDGAVVKQLRPEDYEVNEKDRNVSITEVGLARVEQMLGQPLMDPDRPEDVTPEQARLRGHLEQAMRAQFLFHRNKDYLVQGGKVVIVDEFTGRLMPGRRWSDGLHQAVEAKEGAKIEPENVTYATITLQITSACIKTGRHDPVLRSRKRRIQQDLPEVVPIQQSEYQALATLPLVEVKTKMKKAINILIFKA
jgi:preprotein translocase subunit SecA